VWLAVNNLVVDAAFAEKYEFNQFRKDCLHSLRRYMNELLFDQLPVLKDLQRAIDALTLGGGGSTAASHSAGLLMEAVPQLRQRLLAVDDWGALAKKVKKTVFGAAGRDVAKQRMESLLKVGRCARHCAQQFLLRKNKCVGMFRSCGGFDGIMAALS
jgi:hypothetical protein